MTQYVIGKGGGNAVALNTGMTSFSVVGNAIQAHSGTTTIPIGSFPDNATAIAALGNLVRQIDPEAVQVS